MATLCMNLVQFAPLDLVSLLVLFHSSYSRDQRAKDSLGREAKLGNNILRVIGKWKGRGRVFTQQPPKIINGKLTLQMPVGFPNVIFKVCQWSKQHKKISGVNELISLPGRNHSQENVYYYHILLAQKVPRNISLEIAKKSYSALMNCIFLIFISPRVTISPHQGHRLLPALFLFYSGKHSHSEQHLSKCLSAFLNLNQNCHSLGDIYLTF